MLSSFIATDQDNPLWNDHVAIGLWADLFIVAPATANTISNMAHAVCNNLLLATYLSAKCPVFIAPAMDLDMYAHNAQQKNLSVLKKVGNIVFPVGEGALASGLSGQGRMLEPIEMVSLLENHLMANAPLVGDRILITAGPTHEALDPVRFIGNHSSGKMGFALASAALELGAEVILISGPTTLEINHTNLNRIDVVSAAQMMEAVMDHYANASIAISAAAVCDFTPKHKASQKIKKEYSDDSFSLELIKTKDILGYMGQNKKNQIVIGFALETENEEVNAKDKMTTKNLDAIILNLLHQENEVFNSDKNEITIFHKDGRHFNFKKQSKLSFAHEIFKQLL